MVRINGNFRVGQTIVVKYRDEDREFLARIDKISGDLAIVVDQEDNAFAIMEEDVINWDPT